MSNNVTVIIAENFASRLDRFAISALSGEKMGEVLLPVQQGFLAEISYFFPTPHLCEEFRKGISKFGPSIRVLNS